MRELPEACCEACKHYGDRAADRGAAPELISIDALRMVAAPSEVKIVAVRGQQVHELLPAGPVVRVGRAKDNELTVLDDALSRRQCTITFSAQGIEVADARSNCGTYLDGAKVDRAFLLEGSAIWVGNTRIRVLRR